MYLQLPWLMWVVAIVVCFMLAELQRKSLVKGLRLERVILISIDTLLFPLCVDTVNLLITWSLTLLGIVVTKLLTPQNLYPTTLLL